MDAGSQAQGRRGTPHPQAYGLPPETVRHVQWLAHPVATTVHATYMSGMPPTQDNTQSRRGLLQL